MTTSATRTTTPQTHAARARPEDSRLSFRHEAIASVAFAGIVIHLFLRFVLIASPQSYQLPLEAALVLAGLPLLYELAVRIWHGQFGSDLLAGISIATSILLGQYLAGTVIALMLAGGNALEAIATRRASAVLEALARRMPTVAHRERAGGAENVALEELRIGDSVVIYPHEVCPVDGVVVKGHGVMDESYLTGEPYRMSKTPGAEVLSGAINGDSPGGKF